jgi:hypothetical protein
MSPRKHRVPNQETASGQVPLVDLQVAYPPGGDRAPSDAEATAWLRTLDLIPGREERISEAHRATIAVLPPEDHDTAVHKVLRSRGSWAITTRRVRPFGSG